MRPFEMGNPHGRIALYLDADEALVLADLYGDGDEAAHELRAAVRHKYPAHFALIEARSTPETTDEAPVPGALEEES